jgi:hypothetical protein
VTPKRRLLETCQRWNIKDEEHQVDIPLTRYMAVNGCKIRLTSAANSEVIDELKKMEVIIVTHTKTIDGRLRLRCNRGWASADRWVTGDNTKLMIAASSTNKFYRAKEDCTIRVDSGKNAEKADEKLTKGRVIEAEDFCEVSGRAYIKFAGGWVCTISKKGGKELRQLELVRFKDPHGAIQRRKFVKDMGSVVKAINVLIERIPELDPETNATALLHQAKETLEKQIVDAELLLSGCDTVPCATQEADDDEELLRQVGEGFGLD